MTSPHRDQGGDVIRCPDCDATFQGLDDVTCSSGHKPVRLAWWEICECGDHSHYDMTTFCLKDDCGCQEYTPSDQRRLLVIRSI